MPSAAIADGGDDDDRPTSSSTSRATPADDDDHPPPPPPPPDPALPSSSLLTVQERANELFLDSEILAPMVRASTTPLRTLALRYGASLVYTEEIVDRSILECDRYVNDRLGTIDYVKRLDVFSPKVQRRMKKNDDVPVILRIDPSIERDKLIYQIGTGEPTLAVEAASMVSNDVSGIDVNMGCPKKFSVSGGMGSALLSDLNRACDIIKTLRRNLSVPVSCKIRLLPHDVSRTVDFVRGLANAGANAVAIHGREVGDESTDPARWDRMVDVVRTLKSSVSVPIVINGDLYTRDEMEELRERSGADGVMLARPALYNVSVFRRPPRTTNDDDDDNAAAGEGDDDGPGEGRRKRPGRYGYDSPLLDDKTSVIRSYLTESVKYETHYKNVKYVLCEMMSNRRHPSPRIPHLPNDRCAKVYDVKRGRTIDGVCKCRSLDDLCRLWDVQCNLGADRKGGGGAKGEHRYEDEYFLNPGAFSKKSKSTASVTANGEERGRRTAAGDGADGKRGRRSDACDNEEEEEKKDNLGCANGSGGADDDSSRGCDDGNDDDARKRARI